MLDVLESEGLQQQALETGEYLLGRFAAMAGRFPVIGDVWGLVPGRRTRERSGTMESATARAGAAINHMKKNGVLASTDGPHDNVLKFEPPMVFGRTEADRLCRAVEEALDA